MNFNHPPSEIVSPETALGTSEGDESPPDERITAAKLQACLLTSIELSTLHVPRRPRLLGDWLCAGDLGYIFAARGVGKTWFAMAVPQAISSGKPLGEWQAGGHRAKVLYVDGEMPLELIKKRDTWLCESPEGVTYLQHDRIFELLGGSLNIALHTHQIALTETLISYDFNCIVLDNLSCLATGMDENRGDHHEAISNWLLELRRRKITVIVIHHAGKGGAMRGHSKREDACSWIIDLKDAKEAGDRGAKFISHFAKPSRNTSEPLPDYLWHFETDEDAGRTSIACTLAEVSRYEQFLQHVSDGVDCAKDIAEMMGVTKGCISKFVKKAVEDGRITTDSKHTLKPVHL